MEAFTHHAIGASERGVHVAAPPRQADQDVVLHRPMEAHGPGERGADVRDRRQGIILHLDPVRGVLGRRMALGQDPHDRFADVSYDRSGEDGVGDLRDARGFGHVDRERMHLAGEVARGHDRHDAGKAARRLDVHGAESRMGDRAAHHDEVGQPREGEVVDVPGLALEEPRVLAPSEGAPDPRGDRLRRCGWLMAHTLTPGLNRRPRPRPVRWSRARPGPGGRAAHRGSASGCRVPRTPTRYRVRSARLRP